ncbi:hypothetical protein EJ08DRAFT_696353 [Tothia fuscella]|uniref:Efficient mitochondria targeting-associated protein 19 n=1 Tax=Tothia fuscella TaxID=1048955 RepID=A0A9P4NSW8_9PEZI|nr:hypothetical protein EJ08DRAFT_696353 [Tothia fuscella]
MAPSIFSRKRDLLYLIFFTIHLPIIFAVDIYPLYPSSLQANWMGQLRLWYISTYRDQFFTEPPAWFTMYMWMELLYHVPLCVWAILALVRGDDEMVPVHLLVYAVQTALTTATCVADYLAWEGVSAEVKMGLGGLYVPYLAVSVFMGVDMFGRLSNRLRGQAGADLAKKRL